MIEWKGMGHYGSQRGDQHSIDSASKMPKRCQLTGWTGTRRPWKTPDPAGTLLMRIASSTQTIILEGVGVLRNTVIKTVALRIRKMVDGMPFCGMFLRDNSDRVTLEVKKGRVIKRSCYPPKMYLLSKICKVNFGMLRFNNNIIIRALLKLIWKPPGSVCLLNKWTNRCMHHLYVGDQVLVFNIKGWFCNPFL